MTVLLALALGASPAAEYLAQKAALAKKVEAVEYGSPAQRAADEAAGKTLEPLVRKAVGEVAFRGVAPASSSWSPGTVVNNIDGAGADGLDYRFDDAKAPAKNVFVTSYDLLKAITDVDDETHYKDDGWFARVVTRSQSTDAAFHLVAEVPLAAQDARAAIGYYTQSIQPEAPAVLAVVAGRGRRLFVVAPALAVPPPSGAACDAQWEKDLKAFEAKADEIAACHAANGGAATEKVCGKQTGDVGVQFDAREACYLKVLKESKVLAAYGKQAEGLLKILP